MLALPRKRGGDDQVAGVYHELSCHLDRYFLARRMNSQLMSPPWVGRRMRMQSWRLVLWRVRARMASEIAGAADNRHAHVRCQADRDHVLGYVCTQTHTDIETLGNDVREAVIAADLDLDIGILRAATASASARSTCARHVRSP